MKRGGTMKKSRTVSYTSEELKNLPDESDWEANAAMTDEEIRAAIASDPDDAEVDIEWLRAHKVSQTEESAVMFVLVHDEKGKSAMRRVDKVFPNTDEKSGYVRVMDDTGKSYRVPVQG